LDVTALGMSRLVTHRLAGDRCATPEEVVRWMGAMQAQAYGQALWAIGLRTQAATLVDVERAIAERRILQTWPLRGTLHFIPAQDARWMLTVSAPRMLRAATRRMAQLELDEATIKRSAALFRDALAGGKRLTRLAMMTLLDDAGITPTGQRGYHILWQAAQAGVICLGPLEGRQQTFALLDEWVPGAHDLSRADALAELAGRYFTSHGPATVHDFAWWTGLTLTEARVGLDAAKSRLVVDKRGGTEYWLSAAVGSAAHDASHVHLLPGFDEYVLGYKDRGAVLAAEHASKIVPGNNGVFMPALVVDGQVVGTWTRTRTRTALGLTIHPFAPCIVTDESLAAAAQRYGDFMGVPVTSIDMDDTSGAPVSSLPVASAYKHAP